MDVKLTKGNKSNYEIQITVNEEEKGVAKKKVLKEFGKEIKVPGFRTGHIPQEMVEEQIRPEYLTVGIFEEVVNSGLRKVLEANQELRFIGEPYDINHEEKGGLLSITVKLDLYPEVEVVNDKRKKEKLASIEITPSKEEQQAALMNLKKSYAEYQNTETIEKDTVSKIAIEFLDQDGKTKDKGSIYVGEQEFEEDKFFAETFVGKKNHEEFELTYKAKELPAVLHYNKEDKEEVKKVKLHVIDIKKVVLPEMNSENLKKFFGPDSTLKDEKDLLDYIEKMLKANKEDGELMKRIEELLKNIKGESLKVLIPQTLIDEEQKVRMQNLEKKYGGKDKIEQYFKSIGEEKTKAFIGDITRAATESLEKFFILQKLCELLEIEQDRSHNENLEIERKIYEKFSDHKPSKDVIDNVSEEKKEKPAKKAKKA